MRSPLIIAVIFIASLGQAQNLSVFNLDATNFPQMTAQFYAFDANGVQQNPQASEITITEDGISRTVTNITCPPKSTPPPVTLGIMVDTYSGIDLAKEGAQKLISLISIPPSEAGITMMDHGAFIVQDLTQRISKLDTAIAKLASAPAFDIQSMFYAPNAGGVPFVSGRPNRKVLVLFTDLHCPQGYVDTTQLFADCQKNNISVNIILLKTKDEWGYSKQITERTGGLLFEDVTSATDIDKIIVLIAGRSMSNSPCEITWQSDVACSNPRNVEFDWNGNKFSTSYTIPQSSVAGLSFSPASLNIFSKPIGKKIDTLITITALNSAFNITNIIASNPSYDINPKSFSLAQGASKILAVSYTPPDSSYTWTNFQIQNDHCPQTYYAQSAYPKQRPKKTTIELTKPNGGEQFLIQSDTEITWTGIPQIDTVRIDFSIDGGNIWNLITNKATGGKYSWTVPNTPSDKCLMEVTQLMPGAQNAWLKHTGNVGKLLETSGLSITTDTSGNIYATGYFSKSVNFDGITLTSKSSLDIFIVKYNPDGKIEWAQQAAGIPYQTEGGPKILADRYGNIYLTGHFDTIAVFGNFTLNGEGVEDVFLAKYHSDGTVEWAKRMGGIHTDDESGIGIDTFGNIFLKGFFIDQADFGDTTISSQVPGNSFNYFLAKYLPNGNVAWAKSIDNGSDGGRSG